MFNKLQTNEQAMEEKSDRLGGGYSPLTSDIYKAKVAYAYGTTSKNGAMGLVVKFLVQTNENSEPRNYTQTFWVSDRKGNTFYLDKDGKPHNLAGFNQANHLCSIVTEKGLMDLESEEITIPLYNVDQKKELPTTVNALTDLHNAEIALAIKHIRSNKQEKSATTGEYEPINEERFENDIDKIFKIQTDGSCITFDEMRNDLPAEFAEKWLDKWQGKTDDRYKEVKGANTKAGTTRKLSIG